MMHHIKAKDLIHRWVIFVTNQCNLNCTHCVTRCNKPYNPNDPFRDKPYTMPPEDLELFLDGLPQRGYEIRLTGGEPTFVDPTTLTRYIYTITEKGHHPSLTTNGYGIPDLSIGALKRLTHLDLDDHGINSDLIDECIELCNKHNISYRRLVTRSHYNLTTAIHASQGRACGNWYHLPALWRRVIYPCCNSMLHQNAETTRQALIDYGLSLDNPAWWRHYSRMKYPRQAHEACLYECWLPGGNDIQWTKITMDKPYQLQRGGETHQ